MSKGTQQIRMGRVDAALNKVRNRLHNLIIEVNTMQNLVPNDSLREHYAKIEELEETLTVLEKDFGL